MAYPPSAKKHVQGTPGKYLSPRVSVSRLSPIYFAGSFEVMLKFPVGVSVGKPAAPVLRTPEEIGVRNTIRSPSKAVRVCKAKEISILFSLAGTSVEIGEESSSGIGRK